MSLPGLALTLHLRRGASINVGVSFKVDRQQLIDDVAVHGLQRRAEWIDPDWDYGVFLFRRV